LLALFDAEGTILSAFGAVEELSAFTAEELAGRHAFEFVHEEDLERVAQALDRARQSPETQKLEPVRVRRADEEWTWIEGAFENHLDTPDVRAIVVTITDVTWRLWPQRRLRIELAAAQAIGAPSLEDAVRPILEAICEHAGWNRGALVRNGEPVIAVRHGSDWSTPIVEHSADIVACGEPFATLRFAASARYRTDEDARTLLATIADQLAGACQRIAAQEALEEQNRRYRQLFEMNAAGVFIVSGSRVVDCNIAMARMLGAETVEDLIGRATVTFFADPRERLELLGQVRELGSVHHKEIPLVRVDGAPIWTLMSVTITSGEGEDLVYQGTVIDVTEQHSARELLARSELLHRELIRNFPNGAAGIFDHELRYLLLDGEGLQDTGVSRVAAENRRVREVFPEIADELEPYYRAALAGVPSRFETSFRNREHIVHTLPLRDASGRVYAGLVTCQESTLQKLTEDRLRRAEARLQAIVAAAPDAIVTIRDDGSIDSINPVAERLFGLDARGGEAMPLAQLFDEGVDVTQLLLSDGTFREVEGRRRDGSTFPMEVSFRGTEIDDERVWVGVFRDLTARKESERRLAMMASVPDSNPNPIVELDRHGAIVYTNPAAQRQLDALHVTHPFVAGLRLALMRDGELFQRTVIAAGRIWQQDVFVVPGGDRLRIFGRDVTEANRAEEKLRRVDRLYSILARANEIMVSAQTETDLYHRICEAVVDETDIAAACVVMRDPISGFLKSVAAAGTETRFATVGRSPEDSCLHAAITHGEPSVWVDGLQEPASIWQREARRRGFRCAASFPLHRDGVVTGAICFFAPSPSYAEPGELRLLAAVAADVTFAVASIETERRRTLAEDALARERDFFSAVVDSADALVVVTDRDGRVIRFNRACERLTGYRSEDVRLRLIWEFLFLPDDVSRLRALFITDARHETTWLNARGERRVVSWSTAVLRNRTGEAEFVVVTGLDVTETRLAAEAVRVSEQEFRAIVSKTSELFFKLRGDGTFTQLSQSTAAVLGYEPEDLIGRPAFYFAHSDESLCLIESVASLVREPGSAASGVFRMRHRDNSWRWLEGSATSLAMPDGEVTVAVSARDISERKRNEQRDALQFTVNAILMDGPDMTEAIRPLVEAFGSLLGWELAEFWRVAEDLDRLRFEFLWHAPGTAFDRLEEVNRGLELPLNTVPGRAWATGHAQWTADVRVGPGPIPRLPVFQSEGIRSSLAIPVLGGPLLSGVIVLMSRDTHAVEPEQLTFLEYVSGAISQYAERQWAERELRSSRSRLAEAQRIAHLGDWACDCSSGHTVWSDELHAIFGIDSSAMLSPDSMLDVVVAEERERVKETRRQSDAWSVEYTTTNGRTVYERGERHGARMVGTVQDVTDQRRADAQLRKLSRAVEQSADMIMITDAEGGIEYVNTTFERITGFTKDEVLGRNPRLLQSGRLRPGFYARMWRLLAAGDPFRGVFINRKKDGEEFLEDKTITPLRDERGAIVSYVASGFDTTAERASRSQQIRLQSELRRSIVEWQLTFDAIDAPIVLIDAAGTITRMNRRALDLLEGDYADQIGRNVSSIADSPFWKTVAELVDKVRTRHLPSSRQLHDGRVWDIAVTHFDSVEGVDERLIVIARDVTGIVELQDSLRRSETLSAMGTLVAGVAHEVRNPLFGMSATLDAFETELSEGEHSEYLSAFRDQIGRLNSLMRELLEYGRSQRLTLIDGDFLSIVDEAIENTRPRARERGVQLRRCARRSLPPIAMDPQRLRQAVENLIENAIDHSPPGRTVAIAARVVAGPALVLTVSDEGTGIAPEDIPRLFEPFFTRRAGGTGLGLPIVRRIVEEHGGRIVLENRKKRGATARVTIPLSGTRS